MQYNADAERYSNMKYRRCGNSGLKLPAISFGLWHNFGDSAQPENCRAMVRRAFDLGITHFDIANNYGPPPGLAEENFGRILKNDMACYRDEIIISTKAGYNMWPGPYGEWGSKKQLMSSLDQSLKRLGVEYVDIFYHHRPDPETPLEETMAALDLIVRQGKALYVGISNYAVEETKKAVSILKQMGTPCLIHQMKYSMLVRAPEDGLLDYLKGEGIGSIAFSPMAGGLLTDRYIGGIPEDSRAASNSIFLGREKITDQYLVMINRLNEIAKQRGQKLSQMALSWALRNANLTSALIGASKASQIEDCVQALEVPGFNSEELELIDSVLTEMHNY